MKNIIIFLILFILSFFPRLHAQVNQVWVSRYNGTGNNSDAANSIKVDASGNVYVTGYSRGNGSLEDYVTIKYNSSGDSLWVRRYNGLDNTEDIANSLIIDNSGNVYITGRSRGIGSGFDYATIKYNSSGVQQWVSRYNGTGNGDENSLSITVDNIGNVYVTGISTGSNSGVDYATIKYNSSGDSLWVKRYNGPANGSDFANSIAVDNSGNVYVNGWSEGIASAVDYATIKYDSLGVQLWVQRYNGPTNGNDYAYSMALDAFNNVYVTGESTGSSTIDYTTIKYNSLGMQQWIQRYNGPTNGVDIPHSISIDSFGNVYVTGESQVSGINYDYATIKYNSSGDSLWIQRYNGPGNGGDIARSIAVDGLGNVYITGESPGSVTGLDYATLKYNSSGIQQWITRYNGPGNAGDEAYSIAIDGLGNIYVTGGSGGNGTSNDYATIKYSQLVGIQPISNEFQQGFSLAQNYPNPFNPTTNLGFALSNSSFVRLIIYDALGRQLETLINEQLSAGIYEVDWNASQYSSGVYYYKIDSDEYTDTKRMESVNFFV